MVQGGNLSKAEYLLVLAKTLSSNANKPLTDVFHKLAKQHVEMGAYDNYRKSIEKPKKVKNTKKA